MATEPIICQRSATCDSYILPGGIQSISPQAPNNNTDPVIIIQNSPASQLDFLKGINSNDSSFVQSDCAVYGDEKYLVGLEVCVAKSQSTLGSIVAGKGWKQS